jgi:hypothetical protein
VLSVLLLAIVLSVLLLAIVLSVLLLAIVLSVKCYFYKDEITVGEEYIIDLPQTYQL